MVKWFISVPLNTTFDGTTFIYERGNYEYALDTH